MIELVGLLAVAAMVTAVWAVVRLRNLQDEVGALRSALNDLRRRIPASVPAKPPPASAATPSAPADAVAVEEPSPPPRTEMPPSPPLSERPPWLREPDGVPPADAGDRPSLEQTFAARWLVWLGGITLAIGGVFLVRYAAEHGLLGPAARMAGSFLLGLAMVAGGEFRRRRPLSRRIGMMRPDQVPASLVGAGLFIALAATYASLMIHDLIGPTPTFAVMGGLSLGALALAVVHGPFVGLLGVVSGLLIPALIPSDDPSAWALCGWLAILTAAALVIARRLDQPWLAVAAVAGTTVWSLILVGLQAHEGSLWPGAVLYVLIFPMVVAAGRRQGGLPERWVTPAIGTAALTATAAALAVPIGDERGTTLIALHLVMAGHILIARHQSGLSLAAPIAAASGVVAMTLSLLPMSLSGADAARLPVVASVAMLPLILAGLCWRLRLPTAGWAMAAIVPPLALGTSAYLLVGDQLPPFLWTGIGVLLAAICAGMTVPILRAAEGEAERSGTGPADVVVAGGILAAALALVPVLDGAALTVGVSLLVPAAAYLATRIPVRALPVYVIALTVVVVGRLLLNPDILTYPLVPPVHWVLWGFGIPALALYIAARLLPTGAKVAGLALTRMVARAGALALAVALPTLEIQVLSEGSLRGDWLGLLQTSLRSVLWLSVAVLLTRRDPADPVARIGTLVLATLGLAQIVVLHLLWLNPLWSGETVGEWPVLNLLLLAYLVPAGLLVLVALPMPTDSAERRARLVVAGLMAFAWCLLSVRQVFQGTDLSIWRPMGEAELYAYSVLGLAFSLGLLAVGIQFRTALARHASLGLLMATVVKVFVVDMGDLEGLLRILSFFGLGGFLIGIGWLYQRFVYPPRTVAEAPGPQ